MKGKTMKGKTMKGKRKRKNNIETITNATQGKTTKVLASENKEKYNMFSYIRDELISFLHAVSKSSEPIYLILFTLYIAVFFILKMAWYVGPFFDAVGTLYNVLSYGVMWGTALYLFFIIASWKDLWKRKFPLILTGAVLFGVTGFFATRITANSYGVVFDIVFIILACGKSFRKMLKCTLGVVGLGLLVSYAGVFVEITADVGKPDTDTPGHSLGIVYPNTWGYLLFLALIIIWYLYLRYKPVLTFVIYWACAALCFFYIRCRTIAGLCVIFPILALIVDALERWGDRKTTTAKKHKIIKWLVISIPFLAWAFMLVMSHQTEWLYNNFYYTYLHNWADRFLMGGLYFKSWGVPLFGNPYRADVVKSVEVCGELMKVGILDSSFAAYMIMRGLVWIVCTLFWLCLAHWKALKNRDYAIPFLEFILLIFAMIERPGLEMWYNFVLLYPLAKIVWKEGTERALVFEAENSTVNRAERRRKHGNG